MRAKTRRRLIALVVLVGYVFPLTGAVFALAYVGDWLLAVVLAVGELCTLATIRFLIRRPPPPRRPGAPRLGTPYDLPPEKRAVAFREPHR
jgi:uncharacterized iron-regulated membrane protein